MQKKAEEVHVERADAIQRVQDVRVELGYTIEYVAEVAGVSPTTMRRWENQSHNLSPTARQIVALCSLYNISPSWALMGIGPKSLEDLEAGQLAGSVQGAMESLRDLSTRTDVIISEMQERIARLEEMVDKLGAANRKLSKKVDVEPGKKRRS
jgi:transcriptional regulator with XRE-family HTH domain